MYWTFTFTIIGYLYNTCYHLLFPTIFFWAQERFFVLWEVQNSISKPSCESTDVITNMVGDRHLKSCELLTSATSSHIHHPPYSHLSSCISVERNKWDYNRLYLNGWNWKIFNVSSIYSKPRKDFTGRLNQNCFSFDI